jgi:hypothetical protein
VAEVRHEDKRPTQAAVKPVPKQSSKKVASRGRGRSPKRSKPVAKRPRSNSAAGAPASKKVCRRSHSVNPNRSTRSKSRGAQRKEPSSDHYNLERPDFDPTSFTTGVAHHDVQSFGKVLEAPEYVADIFQRLYHAEVRPYCAVDDRFTCAWFSLFILFLLYRRAICSSPTWTKSNQASIP